MRITFIGAAGGTVTGSCHLLEVAGKRVLLDCGMVQGGKNSDEINAQPFAFDVATIDALVLSHAHIDHIGRVPLLVKRGYRGPIFAQAASCDLLPIMLIDSARLAEFSAQMAQRDGDDDAQPLYDESDVATTQTLLRPLRYEQASEILPGVSVTLHEAGHILGSAMVEIRGDDRTLLFTGDVGMKNTPILRDPAPPPRADLILMESTYGDRNHRDRMATVAELGEIFAKAARDGGNVIIPAFAVGRAQSMLLLLSRVKARGLIPDVPVYLDSPMATDVTRIYHAHRTEHRLSPEECRSMCTAAVYVNSVEESKRIDARQGPMIIVSASGMATGGRVVHHLKAFAPDARNMILFGGFQAAGTRGASLVGGAESIKIHGEWIPVRAEVVQLKSASGHADAGQLDGHLNYPELIPETRMAGVR